MAEESCDSSGNLRKEANPSPPFPGSCANEAARCSRLQELITRSPERRKWETKPNVENPSSAALGDQRPRPLCICVWSAVLRGLRGCGAAGLRCMVQPVPRRVPGHSAPSPPPHAPATRVQAAAGCAWLRATPWSILLRTRRVRRPLSCTRALQTGCPSRPSFSPFLAPIPKRKVLTSSLRAPSSRVGSAGAAPWPRARTAINRRLGGRARRGVRGCTGAAWEA